MLAVFSATFIHFWIVRDYDYSLLWLIEQNTTLYRQVLTASAVTVVPEPASLGLMLALPLLLARPARRKSPRRISFAA